MEHYQAKGVIFMIVAVLFCYSIGMVEQDTALLIIIVMLLGNILNVLCKNSKQAVMMKIVVTGSEGFIGKALCKNLRSRGVEVVGIDRVCGTELPAFRAFWPGVESMLLYILPHRPAFSIRIMKNTS